MGKGIPGLDQAYQGLLMVILIILAIMLMLCLIRAIIGPKIADRVVSVNMMGTMVMVIIGILAVLMKEGFLADVCMIYAMISFLAVITLTKVYTGVYLEKQERKAASKKSDKVKEEKEEESNGSI
ncbi:MAG: monovalent cation/H+ antiporter complex subunit F [Eubacteriales bacterium]|nr:monovalent cation/H+ antiporter complex subunit F [Eubacteriales bacterium]